jgi:peptidoglycan/LPS O-acetylase OafA/YrhL
LTTRSLVERQGRGAPPARGLTVGARNAKAGIPHVRSLDGLRGVAVLAVVLYHFTPGIALGGFLGVDVFFVLSGFLITSLLVAERNQSRRIRLRQFWIRRARRLLPALFLVLIAVGVYALVFAAPIEAARVRGDGIASLFYFANWRFIVSGQSYIEQFLGAAPSPLRHTWSLAIEEQFYLVWPILVAGLGLTTARFARQRGFAPTRVLRWSLVMSCLAAALASAILMAAVFQPGHDPSRVYYGTDTRAQVLLLGGALGALTAGVVAVGRSASRRLLLAAGYIAAVVLVILFFAAHDTSSWLYKGGYALVGMLVVVVIAAAAQPGRNQLGRILSTRPIVGLGLISYGVYLWHWPIAVWVTESATGLGAVALFTVRAALTVGVALVSCFVFEMPIRRGALRRCGKVISIVAAAGPTLQTRAVTSAYTAAPRCDTPASAAPVPTSQIKTILVLGNSVAGEPASCLADILGRRGYRVSNGSHSGAAICDFFPYLKTGLVDPSSRPDAAILFGQPIAITPCMHGLSGSALNKKWLADTRTATDLLLNLGIDVLLVPPIPAAGHRGEDRLAPRLRELAAAQPGRLAVLDAGVFLRDTAGVYQWAMPCISGGEPGCLANGTVQVRLVIDGGVHLCTLEVIGGASSGCPTEDSGGERRAASALAIEILSDHSITGKPASRVLGP